MLVAHSECYFSQTDPPPQPKKFSLSEKKIERKIFCLRICFGDTNPFRGSLSNMFFGSPGPDQVGGGNPDLPPPLWSISEPGL